MRRLTLVTGHFPPGNLASVHRPRLFARHLPEFGWEPTIVTAHWRFYEEPLDWRLNNLVENSIRVIRTRALPTRPIRLVGDIGLRAFPWHYRAVRNLAQAREVDFLLVTIPSNYLALLGALIHKRYGVPYGVDYQDPWVELPPPDGRWTTRAGWSHRLARWLEPIAVRNASLITGVAPQYYKDVLTRNRKLNERAVHLAMPVGVAPEDHKYAQENPRADLLYEAGEGIINMVYAGVMWPQGRPVVERLFEGLARLRVLAPRLYAMLRCHFIGTGQRQGRDVVSALAPMARKNGIKDIFLEHPTRLPYLDVLNHLHEADAVLVFGSVSGHYTPSKIYQAVLSSTPVFAVLHEDSTACEVVERARAGKLVRFDDRGLPAAMVIAQALREFLSTLLGSGYSADIAQLEPFTARASARRLAGALDRALS